MGCLKPWPCVLLTRVEGGPATRFQMRHLSDHFPSNMNQSQPRWLNPCSQCAFRCSSSWKARIYLLPWEGWSKTWMLHVSNWSDDKCHPFLRSCLSSFWLLPLDPETLFWTQLPKWSMYNGRNFNPYFQGRRAGNWKAVEIYKVFMKFWLRKFWSDDKLNRFCFRNMM